MFESIYIQVLLLVGRTTLKKLLMLKTSIMCYLEMKVVSQEEVAKL